MGIKCAVPAPSTLGSRTHNNARFLDRTHDIMARKGGFSPVTDLPVLTLEGELEAELAGQTVTRLEAFVEMVAKPGRPA